MGIFTRMRDIVSSNINAMLDKAENPEKLLRLMIAEMEDTLIEIKAQCAAAMAQSKTQQRQSEEAQERAANWEVKARLAVDKGRDDLAREALQEKRRLEERADGLSEQYSDIDTLIEQYRSDMEELEAKMATVRERQKLLAQRHQHAQTKKRAQTNIRHVETAAAMGRFDAFERRVDHMEAEADLVNYGRQPGLEEEIQDLEQDEEIERELERLHKEATGEEKS